MSPCVTPSYPTPLVTVTSDSDDGDNDSDVMNTPASPSVYATPLTSPRVPGVPGDSEGDSDHFTYNANTPRVMTSGQCDQPPPAHNTHMGITTQNTHHQSDQSGGRGGRSRRVSGLSGAGSPGQSCQEARPININTQTQQHNSREEASDTRDIGEVKQEVKIDNVGEIGSLSISDTCCDKRASDEINFNKPSSVSQQQAVNNSSSETSEKNNHFEHLTTTQQPFKSVITTTTQNSSDTTSYQYEDNISQEKGGHFNSLRRLNSLLGILEQESEREMKAKVK